jgi:hypothetical protein
MSLDDKTKSALKKIKDNDRSETVKYPYNKVKTTAIGHKWELNETEGNEYINLRHGTTGAYIKMFSNGDVQIHSPVRDVNVIAARHINIKSGTTLDNENKDKSDRFVINVVGNAHMLVEGDMHTHVKGNRHDKVDGEYTIDVKDKFLINMAEGGVKCSGTYQLDASKSTMTATTISRDLKKGGTMRDSFAGTYIIEQTSPGGTLKLSSMGDMEIYSLGHIRARTLSNLTFDIAGKVAYNIAGLRVLGTPTGVPQGPLSPFESAFEVNALQGAVRMNATLGVAQYFAGGPYLDVDCLTGVYLN